MKLYIFRRVGLGLICRFYSVASRRGIYLKSEHRANALFSRWLGNLVQNKTAMSIS